MLGGQAVKSHICCEIPLRSPAKQRSGGAPAGPSRDHAAEGDGIDCQLAARPRIRAAGGFGSAGPRRGRLPAPRAPLTSARRVPEREHGGTRSESSFSARARMRSPAASPDVAGREPTARPRAENGVSPWRGAAGPSRERAEEDAGVEIPRMRIPAVTPTARLDSRGGRRNRLARWLRRPRAAPAVAVSVRRAHPFSARHPKGPRE